MSMKCKIGDYTVWKDLHCYVLEVEQLNSKGKITSYVEGYYSRLDQLFKAMITLELETKEDVKSVSKAALDATCKLQTLMDLAIKEYETQPEPNE